MSSPASVILGTLSHRGHTMPGLSKGYDLELASDDFCKPDRRFVALGSGAEEHRSVQTGWHERRQPIGQCQDGRR